VNVYGTQSMSRSILNDDRPLELDDREVLACAWTSESMSSYYNEGLNAEGVETHPSALGGKESPSSNIQLVDCMRLFSEEEKLSKQDAWYCPECKEHVEATKKFDIYKAPPLLVVHLKRFSYRNKFFRERLNQVVHFPLKDFDISEFVCGPCDYPLKYDLYAISNHYGNLGGGHYTAFCRDRSHSDNWFCFDDSSVSPVADKSRLISQAAYVLFYVRQDVEWLPFEEEPEPESSSSTPEESSEYLEEDDDDANYEPDNDVKGELSSSDGDFEAADSDLDAGDDDFAEGHVAGEDSDGGL